MVPMKIEMMLHFYMTCGPFHNRFCKAYVTFVRQLLNEGMIRRPHPEQRAAYPDWAYTATDKGRVYIEALKSVPLPVEAPAHWVMPTDLPLTF